MESRFRKRIALFLFLAMTFSRAIADSTVVAPSTYAVPNTYYYHGAPPYPVGWYMFYNPGSGNSSTTPQNAATRPTDITCPSGTTSKPLVYTKQTYQALSACRDVNLWTGNHSGSYYYDSWTESTVAPMDAWVMINSTNLNSSRTTINTCAYTNYIRGHWYQWYGYAEDPSDCTISIDIQCINFTTLYYFYPATYSTSAPTGSGNWISWISSIACTTS